MFIRSLYDYRKQSRSDDRFLFVRMSKGLIWPEGAVFVDLTSPQLDKIFILSNWG